ncbi:cysteine hydrolase [Flavobacterium branchiicola]|nr:cysteine hydrolase [Flavobacterium branchiicola]
MESTKTEKTALIIIDIQNDYFPGGAMELVEAEKAGQKAKEVLSYFRENKMEVIHVQHIALQEGATFFLPNTKGAEINKIVAPLANEKIFTKNYPNSFRDTKLLEYLKENNITNLVFAGMMTDVCVDATVRASMDNGFKNIVISDAVATRDRELNGETIPAAQINKAFLAGLNALGGLYANVLSSDEFLSNKK